MVSFRPLETTSLALNLPCTCTPLISPTSHWRTWDENELPFLVANCEGVIAFISNTKVKTEIESSYNEKRPKQSEDAHQFGRRFCQGIVGSRQASWWHWFIWLNEVPSGKDHHPHTKWQDPCTNIHYGGLADAFPLEMFDGIERSYIPINANDDYTEYRHTQDTVLQSPKKYTCYPTKPPFVV